MFNASFYIKLPAAFDGDEFIGREITFKVEGRCGDPEAGTQTKSIEAVLDKGATVKLTLADGSELTRSVAIGE